MNNTQITEVGNVELWPIEKLIPYANNPRKNDEAVGKIASVIKEFGFRVPLIAKSDGSLVDGHLRLKAAYKLGLEKVPVLLADNLTDIQIKAFRLSVNKMSELAEWDMDLVNLELEELELADFDIELTGFDFNPLQDEEGLTDEDETPESPIDPVSVLGDVWILGNHRVMCGDSTAITDVDKLMDGQKPNTMLTDPPYGVKYEANWRSKLKGRKKTAREENSSLMNDDQSDWYDAYVLFPGSVAYVWHASVFSDVVMDGLRRSGFDIKQQIIWNKNVHALGRSDYHWKHEPCWYAVKKDGDRNWNGGRTQMTVWDVKSIIYEDGKTAHPTQKPVELYRRPLNFHTNSGEYVYDPFGGSGTLCIAAEELGRRALIMELDPKYIDIIVTRWQNFSGKKATLENDDRTFDDVSGERLKPSSV